MSIDQQLTLLRMAARVDPYLRQAVADVEGELERLREAIRDLEQEISTLKAIDQLRSQGSRTNDIQPSCPECITPQEWTGAAWECAECDEASL